MPTDPTVAAYAEYLSPQAKYDFYIRGTAYGLEPHGGGSRHGAGGQPALARLGPTRRAGATS
jgi:hypothetical protein